MITRENNPYVIHAFVQTNDINALKLFLADESISNDEKVKLINTLDESHQLSPLACALRLGKEAIADILLAHNADVTIGGLAMGKTTLDYARAFPNLLAKIEPKIKDAITHFPKEGLKEDQKAQQALLMLSLVEYYVRKKDNENTIKYLKLANNLTSNIAPVALLVAPITWKSFMLSLDQGPQYAAVIYTKWMTMVNAISQDDKADSKFELEAYINALCTLATIPETQAHLDFVSKIMANIFESIKAKEQIFDLTDVCARVLDTLKDYVLEVQYNNLNSLTQLIHCFTVSQGNEFCGIFAEKLTKLGVSALAAGRFDVSLATLNGSKHYVKYATITSEQDEKRFKTIASINQFHATLLEKYNEFDEVMRKNHSQYTQALSTNNYRLALALMREPFMKYYEYLSRLTFRGQFPIHSVGKLIQWYAVKKSATDPLIIDNYKLDAQFTKENFVNVVRDFDFFMKLLGVTRCYGDLLVLQIRLFHTISTILQTKSFKSVDTIFVRDRLLELIDIAIECDLLFASLSPDKKVSDIKFHGLLFLYKITNTHYVLKNKSDPSSGNVLFKKISDKYKYAFDELKKIFPDFVIPVEYIASCAYANSSAKQYDVSKELLILALPMMLDTLLPLDPAQDAAKYEYFVINFLRTVIGFATLFNKNIITANPIADKINVDALIEATRRSVSFVITHSNFRKKFAKYSHAFYIFWNMQINYYKFQNNYTDLIKSRLFVIEEIFTNADSLERKVEYLLFLAKEFSEFISYYKNKGQHGDDADSINILKSSILKILNHLVDAKMKSDVNEFLQNIFDHLYLFDKGNEASMLVNAIFKCLNEKKYEISKSLNAQLRFHQLQAFEQVSLEKQHIDLLTESLAYCQKYFLKTQTYPKNYDVVLIKIAITLNDWHARNNQNEKALEFCNMVIMRLMQQENPDQQLLKEVLTYANNHMLIIAKTYASNHPVKAINNYHTIIENSDFIKDRDTLIIALNEQLPLILKYIEQLMTNHKYSKVMQICNETEFRIHEYCERIEEQYPLMIDIMSIRQKAEALQKEMKLVGKASHTTFFTSEDIYSQKSKPNKRKSGKRKDAQINENEEVNEKNAKAEVDADFPEAILTVANAKVGNKIEARFLSKSTAAALYPVVANDIADFEKLRKTDVFLYGALKRAALDGWVCREFGESGNKHLGGGAWEAKVVGSTARLFGTTEDVNGVNCIVYRHFDRNGLHKSK